MVDTFTIILAAALLIFCFYVIYKKPGAIKKDESQPLSIKNFSLKKTFIGDWKKFGTWILLMFLIWSYVHDTQACREMIEDIDEVCAERRQDLINEGLDPDNLNLNFSEVNNGDTRDSRDVNQPRIAYTLP